MSNFEKRERAFENKFARDREADFKIQMRACGIFGYNIAREKLQLDQEAALHYGQMIISERLRHVELEKLFAFVKHGLHDIEIQIDDLELLNHFNSAQKLAAQEYQNSFI